MLPLLFSLSLCAGTVLILRGSFSGHRGLEVIGLDTQAMGMGLLAIVAAGVFWGPLYGAALILAVMLHEFGHVAAYRVCGHSDARFRLVPLLGGLAISSSLPASHDKDFFISLMGPAIGLAPMTLSFVLSNALYDQTPQLGDFLWTLGKVIAILNFFNLLPFWPLDGSKCLLLVFHTFFPSQTQNLSYVMSGAALAAGLYLQSIFLILFVLISVRGLLRSGTFLKIQHEMSKGRAVLCFACYIATLAAFLMGSGNLLYAIL